MDGKNPMGRREKRQECKKIAKQEIREVESEHRKN